MLPRHPAQSFLRGNNRLFHLSWAWAPSVHGQKQRAAEAKGVKALLLPYHRGFFFGLCLDRKSLYSASSSSSPPMDQVDFESDNGAEYGTMAQHSVHTYRSLLPCSSTAVKKTAENNIRNIQVLHRATKPTVPPAKLKVPCLILCSTT